MEFLVLEHKGLLKSHLVFVEKYRNHLGGFHNIRKYDYSNIYVEKGFPVEHVERFVKNKLIK